MEKEKTFGDISSIYYLLFRTIGLFESSSVLMTTFRGVYFQLSGVIYYTMQMCDGLRTLLKFGYVEIEYIFEAVLISGVYWRYQIIFSQRRELARLFRICEELWTMLRHSETSVVKSFERKARFIMHYFLWMSWTAVTLYIVTSQVVRLPSTEANVTERRILPFRFYTEVQEQPWFNTVVVLQIVVEYSFSIVVAALEAIVPFLVVMACGYLKAIQNRFLLMSANLKNEDSLSMLEIVTSIKFHQKILQFCKDVQKFTNLLYLLQVLCPTYNISLIGLRLLQHDPNTVKYVPILLLNLQQFFTAHWFPEHLLNESKAIANAAYSVSHIHQVYDSKANPALLFMMLRADCPVQLTAGGYIKLSLESFQRMFMSALSFFAVLRTMTLR